MTVLVLRALGLGDFFTGLPALTMLRHAMPDHRIVLAVPEPYRPLALLSGFVDETTCGHELEPLADPPRRPDIAIDLHGNGPRSRRLLAATEPSRLVAFGLYGLEWDPGEHEVARWCRLIRDGLPAPDVTVPPVAGLLPAPAQATMPSGLTVVHCGAKASARRWPPARFAAVATALRRSGHDVIVTGGPGEEALAQAIGRQAEVPAAARMSLSDLLALVARARLVISGDTGVAHVASNYRTPSVVLFGPVSPAVWGPPADERHQVLWHGDGTGDPHGGEMDPALAAITVDEVLAAAEHAVREGVSVTHG